ERQGIVVAADTCRSHSVDTVTSVRPVSGRATCAAAGGVTTTAAGSGAASGATCAPQPATHPSNAHPQIARSVSKRVLAINLAWSVVVVPVQRVGGVPAAREFRRAVGRQEVGW